MSFLSKRFKTKKDAEQYRATLEYGEFYVSVFIGKRFVECHKVHATGWYIWHRSSDTYVK